MPEKIREPLLRWWRVRRVRWGSLRRLKPVSPVFGFDRGLPIDRYYIEDFLQRHREDIRGHVLEIGDPGYTLKFGGPKVSRTDVLHAQPGNPEATLVADLSQKGCLRTETYDCMILTQTLSFIFDVQAALRNAYEALKPGGVLLATFPGISQISRYDMDRWGDYWRFTEASARRLFGDVFGPGNLTMESHGNVLVACAFLQGLASSELIEKELRYRDPDYPLLIAVRAVKPEK
jgi:SAM-dependent methyltransferase